MRGGEISCKLMILRLSPNMTNIIKKSPNETNIIKINKFLVCKTISANPRRDRM